MSAQKEGEVTGVPKTVEGRLQHAAIAAHKKAVDDNILFWHRNFGSIDNFIAKRDANGAYDQMTPHERKFATRFGTVIAPRYSFMEKEMEKKIVTDTPKSALDVQIGGNHYKAMKIQPVEFCHANSIPFLEANVIKYVCRHKAKGGRKDLEKAKHYIDLLIAMDYGTAEQSPNTGGHPVPPYTPDHLG